MNEQDPQPASTVVLCRITTKWPYKILLLKRSLKARFLPGAHVFPGGRVEPSDKAFGHILAKDHHNLSRIKQSFDMDLTRISAHLGAAIRETLEETGISIVKFLEHNSKIHCRAHHLVNILKDLTSSECLSMSPSLDHIWPISWWITPHGESRRYDTWFFLSLVDDEMCALEASIPHDLESTERMWLYPKEALTLYENQEIFLAPPTRTILERMAVSIDLEEFLSFVDRPIAPINPLFVDGDDGNKWLVLPGDPAHPQKQRSRMPLYTRYAFP